MADDPYVNYQTESEEEDGRQQKITTAREGETIEKRIISPFDVVTRDEPGKVTDKTTKKPTEDKTTVLTPAHDVTSTRHTPDQTVVNRTFGNIGVAFEVTVQMTNTSPVDPAGQAAC